MSVSLKTLTVARPPYLQNSDEVTYFDENNVAYFVTDYTNLDQTIFLAVNKETRVHQRFNAIPSAWIQFTALEPTLTNPDAMRWDFYQDANNFVFRPRANRAVNNWEIFIENAAYGELTGFNTTAGYTYEFKQNPDGTTNHLFSGGAVGANQQPVNITANAPVPSGVNTGVSNPNVPVGVTTFSD